MKRVKGFSLFLISMMFLLCSCAGSKPINAAIVYLVAESCQSMGSITGTIRQLPFIGEYTTQVTAVAKAGYHFSHWSDGYKGPSRTDKAAQDIIYYAYFEA